MEQRRRAKRYPFQAKAEVRAIENTPFARPIAASTRDLSAQGLFLELNQDLAEGSEIHLTLEVPSESGDKPVLMDCVARIVRVVKDGGKVGVGAVIERYRAFRLPEDEPAKSDKPQTGQLPRLIALADMTFGPKHPDAARSLYNVARLYFVQGRHQEATALCLRALAIDDSAPGVKVSEVAETLENYADLLRKLQRGNEATVMEIRAGALRGAPSPEPRA